MRRQHVVVLSGAGISAESGLGTFRGSGGLWEGFRISDVATPEGWERDPGKVLEFYNARRRAVAQALPNEAHVALARLEELFKVTIITQNIDNLHQRAGSTKIIHLHGEIVKARSSRDPSIITEIGTRDIHLSDTCRLGSQLRPHVVWFGEPVPMMEKAIEITRSADIFLVVGTSLEVYPAASLVECVPIDAMKFLVDPQPAFVADESFHVVTAAATEGVPRVAGQLRSLMA